jgi:DnaD/phage-associated family protein
MKTFNGFPERFEFAALPKPFLAQVLPLIDDLDELKSTLIFFKLLYQKKGFPLYLTAAEIAADGGFDAAAAERAMALATARGTVINLAMVFNGQAAALYFLNDEKNRGAVRQIIDGKLVLDNLSPAPGAAVPQPPDLPDIFSLYEQNIGLLTPIIAEELKEALKLYPEAWIKDAIKEAASLNKHNWRYISKILDNWVAGGRNDGTYFGDTQKSPNKYAKGQYGKFVQR